MSSPPPRPADSLEACLSEERRKRKRGGDLPNIPAISLKAMFTDDAEAKAEVARQWELNRATTGWTRSASGLRVANSAFPHHAKVSKATRTRTLALTLTLALALTLTLTLALALTLTLTLDLALTRGASSTSRSRVGRAARSPMSSLTSQARTPEPTGCARV